MYGLLIEGAAIHIRPIDSNRLLRDLQSYVKGCIEVVRPVGLRYPFLMVVNDCGRLEAMPENMIASLLFDTHYPGETICGPAVICKEVITEDGPELAPLEDNDFGNVMQQIYDVLRR